MDYSQISQIAMVLTDRVQRARKWLIRSRVCAATDAPLEQAGQDPRLKQENDRLRREPKRLSDFLDTSSDVVWETNDRLTITSSNAELQLPTDHIGVKLAEALGVNPLASQRWIDLFAKPCEPAAVSRIRDFGPPIGWMRGLARDQW